MEKAKEKRFYIFEGLYNIFGVSKYSWSLVFPRVAYFYRHIYILLEIHYYRESMFIRSNFIHR